MDPKELENVCCNLRSVTQSCKGGVPLNRLDLDYRALLGKNIPFASFGHKSLESFILSIPKFVCMKTVKGNKMVEAVADKTTAHIANMISKQKNSKTGLLIKVPGKKSIAVKNSAPIMRKPVPQKKQNPYHMVRPHPPKTTNTSISASLNTAGSAAMNSIDDYSLPLISSDYDPMPGSVSNKSDVQFGTDDGTESLTGTSHNGSECYVDDSCSEGSWEPVKNPWKQKSSFADIVKYHYEDIQEKASNSSNSQVYARREHSDPKMIELEKAVCINLRAIAISSKTGVLVDNFQKDYRKFVGGYIPFELLGYESLEEFLEAIPDVINLVRNNSGQLIAEAVADSSTVHISKLISKQKAENKVVKKSNQKLADIPPKPVKTSDQSNIQKSTTQLTKDNDSSNSVKWTGKTLGSFPCIRDNITNAHFSTLTGLHNLLFATSYMDTLKEKILNFGGYLFLQNSEEWKKREFLFSVLPLDGLKEYLNLLCIKCSDTDNKQVLLNKLMSFIASLKPELVDPGKVGNITSDTDWYKKCQEKDEKLAEVLEENNKLKAELLKLKSESKSSNEKLGTKSNKKEADQSSQIENLMAELEKLKEQKLAADTKVKKLQKEKGQLEFQFNTFKHEKKTVDKQRKDLVNYLSTLSSEKEKMKTFFLTQLASISDTLCDLVESFDNGNKTAQEIKKGKKKLATQNTTINNLKETIEKL